MVVLANEGQAIILGDSLGSVDSSCTLRNLRGQEIKYYNIVEITVEQHVTVLFSLAPGG